MDFWDQSYYKTTKILTSVIGQWPFQSKRKIVFLRSFTAFCFSLQTLTEEKNILEKVRKNFKYLQEDDERQILHEYTDECGRMTRLYAGVMYICSITACSEPLLMQFFQKIFKFNQSYVPKFFMPMEYPGIDSDEYYYYIIAMTEITVFLIATGIIASDLMLFTFTYHAIALFAALGNSIENLPAHNSNSLKEIDFRYLRICIQKHNRALSFAKSVDDVFIWECLSTIGINMLIISLTVLQVLVNTSVIGKVIKNFLYVTAQTTRLYFICAVAQRLLDINHEFEYRLYNDKNGDTNEFPQT